MRIAKPLFMSFFLFSSVSGAQSSQPLLMVSMGDSITAATFADIPIPEVGEPEEKVQEWQESALKPEFIIENKFFLSWSSGLSVNSHYKRLKAALRRQKEKRPLRVLNVAWPGDTTYDLVNQAHKVIDAMNSGEYSVLKYVTILIGSNDACLKSGPVSLANMRKNLLETFRILSTFPQREPIRILLVGIPRIPDLGVDYVRTRRTLVGLTCYTVRQKILGSCNPLLTWKEQSEYDRGMQVVEDRNRLLQNVTREANVLYPQLEVVYSNRLYNLEIPPEILAVDCFHPAKSGQKRISEEVWLDQPWFK